MTKRGLSPLHKRITMKRKEQEKIIETYTAQLKRTRQIGIGIGAKTVCQVVYDIINDKSKDEKEKLQDIYDIVKKCAERLELVVPIVFVRGDMDKAQVYSVASDIIEPCIVLSKQVVEMCSKEELMFLIGCECGRIQNNHCAYNMAFTYLNYNKYTYRPVERSYKQTVNNQLYTALVQWVKYADITANRAGIICLDKPGMFISVITGLYNKGYIDFYGRQQKNMDTDGLIKKAESVHAVSSRNLKTDNTMSELEKLVVAATEFLYCSVLYEWRGDAEDSDRHLVSGQICDVRSSIIIGNGGVIGG